ncbi:MAG: hypothetical protein ACRDSR_05035 [Pseudonocardiaceae bacterium]
MAGQLGRITEHHAGPRRAWNCFELLRRRSSRREADYLDDLVNTELEFVRQLPQPQRDRPAEALALLALLAQDHRNYGRGWISRRELRDRTERTLADLDAMRQIPAQQPLH